MENVSIDIESLIRVIHDDYLMEAIDEIFRRSYINDNGKILRQLIQRAERLLADVKE